MEVKYTLIKLEEVKGNLSEVDQGSAQALIDKFDVSGYLCDLEFEQANTFVLMGMGEKK